MLLLGSAMSRTAPAQPASGHRSPTFPNDEFLRRPECDKEAFTTWQAPPDQPLLSNLMTAWQNPTCSVPDDVVADGVTDDK